MSATTEFTQKYQQDNFQGLGFDREYTQVMVVKDSLFRVLSNLSDIQMSVDVKTRDQINGLKTYIMDLSKTLN